MQGRKDMGCNKTKAYIKSLVVRNQPTFNTGNAY